MPIKKPITRNEWKTDKVGRCPIPLSTKTLQRTVGTAPIPVWILFRLNLLRLLAQVTLLDNFAQTSSQYNPLSATLLLGLGQ